MARSRFENLDPEKREAIFEHAGREFADKGYEAASLNEIIDRAGISKGSLYYYFDDKEDLFQTVLGEAVSKLMSVTADFALEELDADNFWEELEQLVSTLATYTSRHPWFIRLARTFYRYHDRAEGSVRHTELFDLSRSWTERVIERGQELGVVRDDAPTEFLVEMALAVAEAGDRWILEHFEEFDETDFNEEAARQIDVFRRLLEPRSEEGTCD